MAKNDEKPTLLVVELTQDHFHAAAHAMAFTGFSLTGKNEWSKEEMAKIQNEFAGKDWLQYLDDFIELASANKILHSEFMEESDNPVIRA